MYRIALAFPCVHSVNIYITKGILDYSKEHPNFVYRYFANSDVDGLKELAQWDGDGAIVALKTAEAFELAKELKFPILNISAEYNDNSIPRLYRDHREIGTDAANYLASLGVNEIAYLGSSNAHFSVAKWEAIQARSVELCKPVSILNVDPFQSLFSEEKVLHELNTWISERKLPIGLLIDDDDMFPFVSQALQGAGLRIPQDVAVVSVRDSRASQFHEPTLSSYQFNNTKHGWQAIETLHAMIEGRFDPEMADISLTGIRLFKRESSNILHCNDDRLSKAVEFIKKNANRLLSVDDVSEAVGCSRRTLENSIKEELGYTLRDFIIKEKLLRVDYLVENHLFSDLHNLAGASGFSSLRHLQNVFQKVRGSRIEDYVKASYDTKISF
ncbi:MAG: substrate-binding domain-containing protein [Opitutales bacterium]